MFLSWLWIEKLQCRDQKSKAAFAVQEGTGAWCSVKNIVWSALQAVVCRQSDSGFSPTTRLVCWDCLCQTGLKLPRHSCHRRYANLTTALGCSREVPGSSESRPALRNGKDSQSQQRGTTADACEEGTDQSVHTKISKFIEERSKGERSWIKWAQVSCVRKGYKMRSDERRERGGWGEEGEGEREGGSEGGGGRERHSYNSAPIVSQPSQKHKKIVRKGRRLEQGLWTSHWRPLMGCRQS